MKMSVPNPIFPTLFCFLSFVLTCFSHANHSIVCKQFEKQSLLTFKLSLEDSFNQLSSWNGEVDCCNWNGVVCNNLTGRVHELHLSSFYLGGKLNPSLLNLKYLRYLDLSVNNFNETIPAFVGLFTHLQYLNLSSAGFYGTIPRTIGNISSLHTLSLKSSFLLHDADSFDWLLGLSRLQDLSMAYVNLTKAVDWSQVINSLPSLVRLTLQNCYLDSSSAHHVVNSVNISTSLAFLDLSSNTYLSSFSDLRWIFQLSNLILLDLSGCNFQGSIPSTSNATKLQSINLSWNHFNSTIPNWLYLCKDLELFNIAENVNLNGIISNNITNLRSLKVLDLSFNQISGIIPSSFGNISNLEKLLLSSNQLSGTIPGTLGKLSLLKILDLDGNNLTGNLPESLGQLFKLEKLHIANNMLDGIVTEGHFTNLTQLTDLVAFKNHLTLITDPDWVPPFKLDVLRLGSWNLGNDTPIPPWIQSHKTVQNLDLSRTGISGSVPNWFWKIRFLDLSYNQLHGTIEYLMPDNSRANYAPEYVSLRSNKFSGSLPRISSGLSIVDLSNNSFSGDIYSFFCGSENTTYSVLVLDLRNNNLSGILPSCWMDWQSLMALQLGANGISGSIPSSIGYLSKLRSLGLQGNRISGRIPHSILNCTLLWKINLSNNELEGNIPIGMATSFIRLNYLILRSNRMRGELPKDICQLASLQILDLSDNNFWGAIPSCVGNFTAMTHLGRETFTVNIEVEGSDVFTESEYISTKGRELHYSSKILSLVTIIDLSKNKFSGGIPREFTSLDRLRSLDLSQNELTGPIPDNIGDMKLLESLDLSRNHLSGGIPKSFTALSFLSYLNVSYNNLSGRIPEGTQLQGFDPSSYSGNNLCGIPMERCGSDGGEVPRSTRKKGGNDGNKSNIQWLYVFISVGYTLGVSSVLVILVKKSWRDAYYGLLEDIWDRIYVYFYIKCRGRLSGQSNACL